MKYFAYGTNLNFEVIEKKGLRLSDRQAASLHGYQLIFNKKSIRFHLPSEIGFANLQPDPSGIVEGAVYEIAESDVPLLDKTERCPEHYKKINIKVQTLDNHQQHCFTYQAQEDKIENDLIPSRNYINHILKAKDILSEDYCDKLSKLQTYNSECACCHKVSEVLFLKENEQMFVLCSSCYESKTIWGDVRGKPFTILDTEAVTNHIMSSTKGYSSLNELIKEAIQLNLIKP